MYVYSRVLAYLFAVHEAARLVIQYEYPICMCIEHVCVFNMHVHSHVFAYVFAMHEAARLVIEYVYPICFCIQYVCVFNVYVHSICMYILTS